MSASVVSAQDARLLRTLENDGNESGRVVLWRDATAHSEGLSLVQAGVHRSNPSLVVALTACIVPRGTEAIITSAGFATHDVLVVSGPHSGCRGNVAVEHVKKRQ